MKPLKIIVLTSVLAIGLARPNQAAPKQQAVETSEVFVIGQVQKPGAFIFSDKWRLLDAIVVAGGVSAKPRSLRLSILRSGKKLPVDLLKLFASDPNQNLPLQSGDAVIVYAADSATEPTVPLQWLNPRSKLEQRSPRDQGQFKFNGSTVRVIPLSKKDATPKQK